MNAQTKNHTIENHISIATNNFPKLLKLTRVLFIVFLLIAFGNVLAHPAPKPLIIFQELVETCLMLILMFFLAYGSGFQKLRNTSLLLPDSFFFLFALFFSRSFIRAMETIRVVAGIKGIKETSTLETFLFFLLFCTGLRYLFYYLGEKRI